MSTPKSAGTSKVTKKKQASKAGGKGGKPSKSKATGEKNKGEGPRGQSQSCHQCRQSIHSSKGVSEVKSGKERLKCSTCTRYWCEQCLHNRYGVIKTEVDVTVWTCPVCNKNCNCSLCRKKEGKLATGILTPLVKNAGFGNVSDFLDKGTDDIAKVLQWKSPDAAEAVRPRPNLKKQGPGKQATCSPSSGPSRKRKRHRSGRENSETLATSASDCQSSSGCHGDDLSCHGSRGPKRLKLNHSRYSITLEEDSVLSLETPSVTKVDAAAMNEECMTKDSCGESSAMDLSPAASDGEEIPNNPISSHRRSSRRKATPKRYGAECRSKRGSRNWTRIEDKVDGFADFLRRSPRRKVTTQKYVAEDFREGFCSPASGRVKRNNSLSPNRSPKLVLSQGNFAVMGENVSGQLSEKKQEELDALKGKRFEEIQTSRIEEKQKVLEERARLREEQRMCRQKMLETKARLREEEKVRKLAEQEKLRMARSILKEAQRSSQKRRREREKERKQRELKEMKEKNAEERKRRRELCNVPAMGGSKLQSSAMAGEEELPLVDDSPENCEVSGIPALPELPTLDLHVSAQLAQGMLVVCEFLHTFADALNLKRKLRVDDLFALLSGGRGLSEVYLALLRVVMEEEEDRAMRKELKPTKKKRDLEEIARRYLHKAGKNGFVTPEGGCACLEESIVILEHLCQEALQSDVIVEYMDSARERAEMSRREHRNRERQKTKQISDELKQLCEGGCSLADIEDKRRDFTRELAEIRTTAELEQHACGLALRNTHLGEDRYGRTYWHLQCFPGVLVEVVGSPEEGEDIPINGWCIINTEELLEQFLECLHPQGRKEKWLHRALELHKTAILSSLTFAFKQETAVKRFYGRR